MIQSLDGLPKFADDGYGRWWQLVYDSEDSGERPTVASNLNCTRLGHMQTVQIVVKYCVSTIVLAGVRDQTCSSTQHSLQLISDPLPCRGQNRVAAVDALRNKGMDQCLH